MFDLILDNTYLILLLPFWIFLIIMSARFFAIYVNDNIINILTLFSSLTGAVVCFVSLLKLSSPIEQLFPFIKINNFTLNIGLYIDKLSLIIALLLFSISFFVQWFSIFYMKNEPKKYRFFAFLNLFNFVMAALLFSPNLFQMYFFWELVGVISYLLIGFDYSKQEASQASFRVFMINRFGDTALLAGIIITSYLMYNYAGNYSFATLSLGDMNAISTLLYAYTSTPVFYLICVLFLISAFVKSAQFPFHTWLQDAMVAKLPVSALLHSATLVVLGTYLVFRLMPFCTLESNLLKIILCVGIITAFICSIFAAIETHPKKVLAYSTSANLGLVFVAIGVANIKAALLFLIVHAFIKSLLFLTLDEKEYYINYIIFLLASLSLSGIIFDGLIAKECLFLSLQNNTIISILYCVVAFVSSFYILRLAIVMVNNIRLVNRVNIVKIVPISMLFISNIVLYLILRDKFDYKIAEPFWTALLGWVAVYLLFKLNLLMKFVHVYDIVAVWINKSLPALYNIFTYSLMWFEKNIIENYKPLLFFSKMLITVIYWVEEYIMNGIVRLTAYSIKKLSELDSKLQNRNVQNYNAYAFIIISILICFVIISYTIMLNQLNTASIGFLSINTKF